MTDGAVQRAIQAAVRQAFAAGADTSRKVSVQTAIDYAESLILPIVEARVEQAIEEGFASARGLPGATQAGSA